MEFIWILLMVFVFVYSAVSKAAKEQKRLNAQNSQEDSIDDIFEDMWNMNSLEKDSPEDKELVINEYYSENYQQIADEIKPKFEEGVSSVPNVEVPASVCNVEKSKVSHIQEAKPEKGEKLSGIKGRLKENSKDFVVLGEVLKPKYKEY